jgi:hypothetical protein
MMIRAEMGSGLPQVEQAAGAGWTMAVFSEVLVARTKRADRDANIAVLMLMLAVILAAVSHWS